MHELDNRLQFERLLADLSARFVNIPAEQIDEEIKEAQRRVCNFLGLDLSSVWQLTVQPPRFYTITHLYGSLRGPALPERTDARELFPWCLQLLLAGKVLALSSLKKLPEEAARDQAIWQQYGIKSVLAFPLIIGGESPIGYLMFNTTSYERDWPDLIVQRVQLIAQIIANALARKRSEQALRESEFRYRLIAENTADVIWLLDLETQRLRYVSPSVRKLRGYTPEEVMAQPVAAALTPESAERMRQLFSFWIPKFLANPSVPVILTNEFDQPCKDGSIIHTEVSTNAILNENGKIELIGVTRNITERKRAEEEKAKLAAQLQQAQKMESVGRLAGGVAHDFNNMLSVILGYLELVLNQVDSGHPLYDDLLQVQAAAQHSADLTRQLLAFARRQAVAPIVLDLNETVSGMVKMFQRFIGSHIDIVWKPGQHLWPVKMDPSQIDQILANLAVNARDAIVGVGTLTIETSNVVLGEPYCAINADCVPGKYVLLSVRDTGVGMDKETLAHIFEPFFTTKGVGKGTGLGLSTVYGIVKQNEGCIGVQSQPGHGTVFEIYLPPGSEKTIDVPAESNP